jgi:penicillin amidase
MTTLHFDVQDLYFNEQRVIAQQKETIRIRGRQDAEITIPITPHGPIVDRNGQAFALRWTPYDGQYAFPFVELNRAKNWPEFRKALSRFPGPSHNFVYADVDGNIGYQAAGKMPIRKTEASGFPLDATKAENEWLGYIPFEELPSHLNPPRGEVITANQNPFPENYKYPVAGHFTPPYRQRQIAARLGQKTKWDAKAMTSIQMDVYSAFHHFFAQEVAKAAKKRQAAREDFAEAREILASWNGQMEVGQPAPLIAVLTYDQVWEAVMKSAGGPAEISQGLFPPAVVEKMLREKPKEWFADYDQLLVSSLLAALDEGSRKYGKNPKFWDYGRHSQVYVANLVLSQAVNVGRFLARPGVPFRSWIEQMRLPLIDGYVQQGPLPLSGGTQTVKQVNPRLGPAFRFIADTANWENSTFTLTLGQSGHAFARHSLDYWNHYHSGGAVPLLYQTYAKESTLNVEPRFAAK